MKIERVELRKVRLPYLAPFITSGWREDASHAIIVRLDGRGHHRLGRVARGGQPLLQRREPRHRLGHPAGVPRPHAAGGRPERTAGCDGSSGPRALQPHGQVRAGVRRVGSLCQTRGPQPGLAAGRHARSCGRGRQRRHPEGHRHAARRSSAAILLRATRASSSRFARAGTSSRRAPCARPGRTSCFRSTPTASITSPTPITSPSLTSLTCC